MKRPLIALALVLAFSQRRVTSGQAGRAGGPVGSSGESAGAGSPATEPTAACAEAFAPIADLDISALSDLGDHKAEVAPTIQGCESVADWIAGAQPVIDVEINPEHRRTAAQYRLRGPVAGRLGDLQGACIVLIDRRRP